MSQQAERRFYKLPFGRVACNKICGLPSNADPNAYVRPDLKTVCLAPGVPTNKGERVNHETVLEDCKRCIIYEAKIFHLVKVLSRRKN